MLRRDANVDLIDIHRALSREMEAVLITARTKVDEDAQARLAALVAGGLEWATVTELAMKHQVLPLVAATLPALHRADLPDDIADWLTDYTRRQTARNMRMTASLFSVLDALEAENIPAFPYKGPTLAAAAYGSIRFRSFGDLDLLVPKDSYLDAKAAIERIGFAPMRSESSANHQYLGRKAAHPFARDDVRLDLQWGSTTRKALSVPVDGSFWDIRTTIDVLGRPVRAIPADMLFLFICAHGSRHFWDRLKWVCDVGEMIRSHRDLDWTETMATARSAGVARVVHMAVLLAESLVGAGAPQHVLDAARRDSKAAHLAALAVDHPLTGRTHWLQSGAAQRKFTMATKERILDRARYFADVTIQPTEEDYEWVTLPGALGFLYPLLRPVRLLVKGVNRRLGRASSPTRS